MLCSSGVHAACNRVFSINHQERTPNFLDAHLQMRKFSLSCASDYYQPELAEKMPDYKSFPAKPLTLCQRENINQVCLFTCQKITADQHGNYCLEQPICIPVDDNHVIVCSFWDIYRQYEINHKKNPITHKPMDFTQWFIPI